MKPSLRIALYCRTSPSDPHGAGQEQALRQVVAGAGGEIVGVWHSGTTATREHCSVRQVVLDLARSGEIDAVWVTALTRVMARIADGQSYMEIARALKLNKNTITAIVRRHRRQQTGQDADGR